MSEEGGRMVSFDSNPFLLSIPLFVKMEEGEDEE